MTLAFDDWKEGHVAPATFVLPLPEYDEPEQVDPEEEESDAKPAVDEDTKPRFEKR
jgi:hypothetical protein